MHFYSDHFYSGQVFYFLFYQALASPPCTCTKSLKVLLVKVTCFLKRNTHWVVDVVWTQGRSTATEKTFRFLLILIMHIKRNLLHIGLCLQM